MSKKQEICAVIAGAEFLLAGGIVEKQPAVALILIAAMAVPMIVGRLGKRRVTCAEIERRCRNAEK